MNLFNARETLAASFRNQRSKRIPFTAGQVFGLTINENMSEACLLAQCRTAPGAALHAPAGSAAGAFMVAPAATIAAKGGE